MKPEIRIGIVGANPERGWAKDAHIPALKSFDNVRITAVSARNMTIANAAADKFSADQAFDDSIELTRDPNVDIVAVTVKVPEHREIVLSALDAGKHVYCEWPLGRNLAEAEEMAEAAIRAGVHVAIGLQGNVSPAILAAAELVKAGELGELETLQVFSPTAGWGSKIPGFYAYLSDKRNGATLATITGGHTLAAVMQLVGEYSTITATSSIRYPKVEILESGEFVERTCADNIAISGTHSSRCVSELQIVGGEPPETSFQLELQGTRGQLQISSDHPGGFQVGNMTLLFNGEKVPLRYPVAGSLVGPPTNVAEMYCRFFVDIENDTQTIPGLDDAIRLTRLLDLSGV